MSENPYLEAALSKNLYWREVPRPPEPLGSASLPLKRIIAERCYGHDGSLRGEPAVITAGSEIDVYLQGYLDARQDDEVAEFLEHLHKYKRLEVWIDE